MKLPAPIIITAFLLASNVLAQDFGAELDFSANPVEQSILIFEEGNSRLIRANLEKRPGSLLVSAGIGELKPEALLAASVTLSSGEIRSTALHHPGDKLFRQTSTALLSQEIASQQASNASRRQQLEDLNKEIETVSSDLRKRAGLEKVDAMYQKVSELKALIAQEQKLSADLDLQLSALLGK